MVNFPCLALALMLTHSLLTYNNVDIIEGIDKSDFEKLLHLATQELYFMFNGILYKEEDGVAMGSPLGPTMGNIFLSFDQLKWLELCPNKYKFRCFFTEDMLLIFLFYLNQLTISQNFMHVSIHVIRTCLFHLDKKQILS